MLSMKKIILFLFLPLFCHSQIYREEIKDAKEAMATANDSMKIELYGNLFDLYRNREVDTARLYLDSMGTLARQFKDATLLGKQLRHEGTYFARINDYRKSEDSIRKAINLLKTGKDQLELAHTYNNLGLTLRSLGMLDSAMRYHVKSLKIRERLGASPRVMGQNYTTIGVIHGMLLNYEKANDYFLKAEKIYLQYDNERLLAGTWNKIALNNKNSGDLQSALFYYTKADSLYAKRNNLVGRSLIQNNLCSLYLNLNQDDIAKTHCLQAYDLSKKANRKRTMASVLNNLSVIALNEKNYALTIDYVTEAQKTTKETGVKSLNIHLFQNLAAAYEGMGDYKRAYENRIKHFNIYDSIFNEEKTLQINELETKYQTEKKEAALALQEEEIKTLNEKSRADNLQKGLYAGGMASALALFGLSVFGYRQRIKRNRIAREKQEEIYKQEIAHKQKELASQTLHLVQKNTFIQELKENLENLKNSPEKFKAEFRRIVMLLKKENASDKDWEVFKTYFADVHNDFDQKLKTLYADISEKEIRLAAFLRMNLTTKEIAATLNVLPESILKSKYRLKKKLNLDKETDLTSFLNTL